MLDNKRQPFVPERAHFSARQREAIELLTARGVLARD
jgi:hypothetical protein